MPLELRRGERADRDDLSAFGARIRHKAFQQPQSRPGAAKRVGDFGMVDDQLVRPGMAISHFGHRFAGRADEITAFAFIVLLALDRQVFCIDEPGADNG